MSIGKGGYGGRGGEEDGKGRERGGKIIRILLQEKIWLEIFTCVCAQDWLDSFFVNSELNMQLWNKLNLSIVSKYVTKFEGTLPLLTIKWPILQLLTLGTCARGLLLVLSVSLSVCLLCRLLTIWTCSEQQFKTFYCATFFIFYFWLDVERMWSCELHVGTSSCG